MANIGPGRRLVVKPLATRKVHTSIDYSIDLHPMACVDCDKGDPFLWDLEVGTAFFFMGTFGDTLCPVHLAYRHHGGPTGPP